MIRSTIILAVVVCLVSFSRLTNVYAEYEFVSLYSSSAGELNGFSTPAINDAGVVTFRALINGRRAILSGDGNELTVVAEEGAAFDGTTFTALGAFPSINNCGTVVFKAELETEVQGIYTGNGGVPSIVVDTSGPIRPNLVNDFGVPDINNFDAVLFAAGFDEGGAGTFKGTTGSISQLLSRAPSSPSLNDAGTIAYGLGGELFTQQRGATTNLTDNEPRFSSINELHINNPGAVAFAFWRPSVSGIAVADSEGVNIVADNSGDFSAVTRPSINDNGDIVFWGNIQGDIGLFVGGDAVDDRVIIEGDPLLGSTLTGLQYYRNGFNNQGQIAFQYSLANGQSGIAVATVDPEARVGSCPGDLDFNGVVDFGDNAPLLALLVTGSYEKEADFDFDGAVTFRDIPLFINFLAAQ